MSDPDRLHTTLSGPSFDKLKRYFDLINCILMLPILLPVMLVISLLIKLDSSGPVLFRQTRIGKDSYPFDIIKFRTLSANYSEVTHQTYMVQYIRGQLPLEAQEGMNLTVFKPPICQHVTRVGRFLRKTSLDELPQIINVFRGEMSLIGPRPHIPGEVAAYAHWHRDRLKVLPGITGLAQLKGRSELPFDKLTQYDLQYIQQQSLRLDFKIFLLTIPIIFTGRGAK